MYEMFAGLGSSLLEHWNVWLVTTVLVVAAIIDGMLLKVPNWLTFPFIITGWVYSTAAYGWEGLYWSLGGTVVGLVVLLIPYSIGGMGAGDVKLMAGVGAWMYGTVTLYGFCATTIVGAVLAIGMIVWSGQIKKHYAQCWLILNEIYMIRDPEKLSAIAAERKPSMRLLPYGIPMAIGIIGYFVGSGMLT